MVVSKLRLDIFGHFGEAHQGYLLIIIFQWEKENLATSVRIVIALHSSIVYKHQRPI